MLPSASALEGEALRAADTLAALNLVDSAGAAVDYNLNNTATRAQAAQLLVRLAGAEDAARDTERAAENAVRGTERAAKDEVRDVKHGV